ncbi:MAG: AraC family transcriptional regulator [Prevotella sp.]|nr:AraC family transcriptional regulator [Prevotella sp.]
MDFIIIFALAMKEGFTGERSIVLPPIIIEAEQHDPLVSSLYITDIGYYPHAEGHFRERRQAIDAYVLIYCMEGRGWYEVQDKRYEVQGNQYFILPPGYPHAYGASANQPWTIYWLHFTGNHAAIYSEGQLAPQDITPAPNSRINERQHIFEEIFSTLQYSTDSESLRYASSLLHYYLASMRYLRHYRHPASLPTISDSRDFVAAVTHYMHENLERRLTLDDLAHYTGYSPSHFSLLFRQQAGESPLARFTRLKLDRACILLQTTDMRINQICHKLGFDDPYYFSRLFKQQKGLSPKQYRIQH